MAEDGAGSFGTGPPLGLLRLVAWRSARCACCRCAVSCYVDGAPRTAPGDAICRWVPPMLARAVVLEGTASLCDPRHEKAIVVTRLLAIGCLGLAVAILIWVVGVPRNLVTSI